MSSMPCRPQVKQARMIGVTALLAAANHFLVITVP